MIVCVLVATAVYDQGVVGVYTGEDAEQKARDAAAEIWPRTDGHHGFRIDKLEVDKTYENVFQYASPNFPLDAAHGHHKARPIEPEIEVFDRTDKRE